MLVTLLLVYFTIGLLIMGFLVTRDFDEINEDIQSGVVGWGEVILCLFLAIALWPMLVPELTR